MSLDTIDRITRNANEALDALRGIAMSFDQAVSLHATLAVIPKFVDDLKVEIAEDKKELLDTIEGLLANWPHSEVVEHYEPQNRPVLIKAEALKRAAAALKTL